MTLPASTGPSEELILAIDYQLECRGDYASVPGTIDLPDRQVRFDLVEGRSSIEVGLGTASSESVDAKVELEAVPDCILRGWHHRIRSAPNIVLRYAPYLVVREDQYDNRATDVPIGLAYSVSRNDAGNQVIRYTVFFTDEDSESTAEETDSQMARYGRRTDIEWLYEVELDANGAPLSSRYQGGVFLGMGHATYDFDGEYLPGGTHPILYDIADHNVFSPEPDGSHQRARKAGYQLVPRYRIESPQAREQWMFSNPWSFAMSDAELKREGKLSLPSEDWLYVLIDGILREGEFQAELRLDDGQTFLSGNGNGNIDRLGEDLWGRESYTAVPLSSALLDRIGAGKSGIHGQLRLINVSSLGSQLQVGFLKFSRLRKLGSRIEVVDLSQSFACDFSDYQAVCRF